MIVKPYPKDDEPRTLGVRQSLLDELAARIAALGLDRNDLLFPSTEIAGGSHCPATRFARACGYRRSRRHGSILVFACTTCGTHTPHGSWLAEPTSRG